MVRSISPPLPLWLVWSKRRRESIGGHVTLTNWATWRREGERSDKKPNVVARKHRGVGFLRIVARYSVSLRIFLLLNQ